MNTFENSTDLARQDAATPVCTGSVEPRLHVTWQPIETAPKDGREVLALGLRHGDYGYTDDEKGWTGIRWMNKGWQETKPTGRYSNGFTPTHWMPLPAPPEAGE